MSVAVITGSAGLVGSEAVTYFASLGMQIVGIDNDMRRTFFGEEASTAWVRSRLERDVRSYMHVATDIQDQGEIFKIFERYGKDISLVIHTASQPSHDWAASNPLLDFTVNERIIGAARERRGFAASALAVHGNALHVARPPEDKGITTSIRNGGSH